MISLILHARFVETSINFSFFLLLLHLHCANRTLAFIQFILFICSVCVFLVLVNNIFQKSSLKQQKLSSRSFSFLLISNLGVYLRRIGRICGSRQFMLNYKYLACFGLQIAFCLPDYSRNMLYFAYEITCLRDILKILLLSKLH